MTFYWNNGSSHQAAFKTWITTVVAAYFPDDVSVSVPNSGDVITPATGVITGTWTDGTVGSAVGGNNGNWSAGVGARVLWLTAGRRSNRIIRGTTFLVPCASIVFDTSGNPSSTFASGLATTNATLLSSVGSDMVVWSRPTDALRTNGFSTTVTGSSVPVRTTWLSTRRT